MVHCLDGLVNYIEIIICKKINFFIGYFFGVYKLIANLTSGGREYGFELTYLLNFFTMK